MTDAIDRTIAEKVLHMMPGDDDWYYYEPTADAGQAFDLVERFKLDCARMHLQWAVRGRLDATQEPYFAIDDDLKTAICICVLRMHGIDPEAL
jgi:hypothetical protein